MARLCDRSQGLSWSLTSPEVTIGRSSDNRIVLDHPELSRRHARLLPVRGGWLVEDLGSAAGTTVNGGRVRRRRLSPGDDVGFGPLVLRFELEPDEPATTRPPGPVRRSSSPARLVLAGCGVLALLSLVVGGGAVVLLRPRGEARHSRAGMGEAGPPPAPALVPADVGAPALPPLQIVRGARLARTELDPGRGGEVVAGSLRLSFPRGALDRKREISVHAATVPPPDLELAPLGGRPAPARVLAAWDVDLGAGAGQLPGPVDVSIDLAGLGLPREAILLPLVSLDGRTWTRLPARVTGSTLRFTTRHFCAVSLVGLLEAAGFALPVAVAGYLIYDRAREFPSACSEHAPFVSFELPTDPEGFEVSWSTGLDGVDATSGLEPHDPAALVAGIEALVKEHQRRAGLATVDVTEWPAEARRDLAVAVDRLVAETLVPDVVRDVKAALFFARDYIRKRGFDLPVLDLPVYVTPGLDGDSGFLHNPWSGRRYVVLSAAAPRPVLWTTALHELFHHVQTGYVWVDRTGHLPLMEASALLLEREAESHYRAAGQPFAKEEGLGLAQLLAFHHGLDGPADWQEAPVRRFGYGLTWFLEALRDRARTPEGRGAFHAGLLRAWSNASFSAMRTALAWAAGGDEEKLRAAWRAFARGTVLRDLEHDAGSRGPIGAAYACAPFTDSPYRDAVAESGAALKDAYGFDPTVLDFAAQPLHALAEPRLRPWSIQYYRCVPPARPDAQLVLRVPRELAPAEGPAVDVYVRSGAAEPDPAPASQLDRAPAGSEALWASLPFDGERFAYLVDAGRAGGWVSSAPPVTLMLLEPPAEASLSEEGGVVKVSWTPPALAGAPGVPLGFRVEVTDGPRWTMVVAGDQTSTQIDYRGEEGRNVSTVTVATVLQIGTNEKGEPVFLSSAPATASRFGLRGRQSMRLRATTVEGTGACDNGRPPQPYAYFECADMPISVDASGGFTFACEQPWHWSKLSGQGRATGDRLQLQGTFTLSRSQGELEPETTFERLEIECTFSGETRLKSYPSEGSAGIEKGLRGACTSSLDRQERSADTSSWVRFRQSCTSEVDLTGSYIPLR